MLKEVKQHEALLAVREGGKAYMMIALTDATTLGQLFQANRFFTDITEPKGETKPKAAKQTKPKADKQDSKIDHGKIVALHKAGWSASAIANEVGCSAQTVLNHLKQEEPK